MHAYLISLEIEPVDINKVYVALPLHCTVVHWFRSTHSPAQIVQAISDIVHGQPPIELTAADEALFGRDGDVPVNLLVDNSAVLSLHTQLYRALQQLGVQDVEPMWTLEGFTPHVTRQSSGRFETGRSHIARRLYIVEALAAEELQQKKIVNKLFLGRTTA